MLVLGHTAVVLYIAIPGWMSTDPSFVEDQREVWSTFVFVIDLPLTLVAPLLLGIIELLTSANFSGPWFVLYFAPFWFMLWGGINWYLIGCAGNSIEKFFNGHIDNWKFDCDIFSLRTDDRLVLRIRRQIWLLYDDTNRYFNSGERALSSDDVVMLKRWVKTLRSNIVWNEIIGPGAKILPNRWIRFVEPRLTPKAEYKANRFWPFADATAWEKFEHSLPLIDVSTCRL